MNIAAPYAEQYDQAVHVLNNLAEPLSAAARLKLGMEIVRSVLRDMGEKECRDEVLAMVCDDLSDSVDGMNKGKPPAATAVMLNPFGAQGARH